MRSLEPIVLRGTVVQLEPLGHQHADALVRAADADRSSFGYTNVPDGDRATHSYIDALLADAVAGSALPFVQRRLADGAVVGCTRFMDIRWRAGHDTPVEVEIGGTWYARAAQGTRVNPAAKRLLLRHAFACGAERVELKTDARNARSRAAILKLGATFEGVFRHHMRRPDGSWRDTAWYSILREEWPAVEASLNLRLQDAS